MNAGISTRARPIVALVAALALGAADAPSAPAPHVLVEVTGAQLMPRTNARIVGGTIEGWFEGTDRRPVDDVIPIPGHPTEAYMTVVLELDDDFTAPGGKLPGLANTGNTRGPRDPCILDGVALHPSGWGGRDPDGCHWSARTQFIFPGRHTVGAATYFYALSPRKNEYGMNNPLGHSFPKGRWFAYVEHVKMNTSGRRNGELAYWLIDTKVARNGKRVYSERNILWRTTDVPQSAINEMWAELYCGGTNCGPHPWPRSTVRLARLAVTDALPDMAAIETEVDQLNASGPPA